MYFGCYAIAFGFVGIRVWLWCLGCVCWYSKVEFVGLVFVVMRFACLFFDAYYARCLGFLCWLFVCW